MESLAVKIKNLQLRSPLMTASGTSGHSNEIEILQNSSEILSFIGAFVTKGVTLKARMGNPKVRIIETRFGILNSIGLQNNGVEYFVRNELPGMLNFNVPIIVNISADTEEEFGEIASFLSHSNSSEIIGGIEINVSCPNIKKGGVAFGTDPRTVERIVKNVKNNIDDRLLVITKLTPNVTDITVPARAAIDGGTDAISLINTIRGMAIDINTGSPYLGNKIGGLSGPAIKPVGIFMVYECFEKIRECYSRKIPIIGIGGISSWQDAIEYLMAGATAVGIGSAWFVSPNIFKEISNGIKKFIDKKRVSISDLVGKAHEKNKDMLPC